MADISKITLPNGTSYDIKDATARSTGKVSGVKGNAESSYRTGNVNLKAANLTDPYGQGTLDPWMRSLVDQTRANRLAFLPASQIIIEQTTDGGETWFSGGYSDAEKTAMMSGINKDIRIPLLNGEKSTLCGTRITITGMRYDVPSGTAETEKYDYWNSTYVLSQERYFNVREWWFWVNANTDRIRVQIEKATGANSTTWVNVFNEDFGMSGWSGSDWLRAGAGYTFGGGINQTANYWNWRLTFWSRMVDGATTFASNIAQLIAQIRCYGDSVWRAPYSLMEKDHLYTWDYQANATFPAKVTATGFSGPLTGNASTATEFAANKTIALTGDVTGSASSKGGWSVATTLANSGVTAGSYGPSANASPSAGGTVAVPQVTVDAKGRVTSAASRTITLPTDAATVNGHTVAEDVPAGAVFTDTTYENVSELTNDAGYQDKDDVVALLTPIWTALGTGVLILEQPEDNSGAVGDLVPFSVTAIGTGLTYQWQYYATTSPQWRNSSSSTLGYNTDTLRVEATTVRNGYRYRCIVTDGSSNSVTSSAATLTVSS